MSAPTVLLTDGALGTEYRRRGLPRDKFADVWNFEAPDQVLAVTAAYAQAGSDVVLTTTFRANPVSLAAFGRATDVRRINVVGAQLARQAAPGKLVFGDAGPTGRMLAAGEIGADEVEHAFAVQCEGLAEGGVDAVAFETFSDVDEAKLAVRAAANAGLKAVVSFTFHVGSKGDRTMTGLTPEDVARQMQDAGAWAVGANCGAGFDEFVEICRRMRAVTTLPLWMKPNAGLPTTVNGELRYPQTPAQFALFVRQCVEAGANYIGGCCGTTPEFIRAAATALATQA